MELGKQQLAHWIYVLEGLMMSIFQCSSFLPRNASQGGAFG